MRLLAQLRIFDGIPLLYIRSTNMEVKEKERKKLARRFRFCRAFAVYVLEYLDAEMGNCRIVCDFALFIPY